jgi:hypothetical protein
MTRLRMERRASDNTYLHKDFHGALSAGLDYLRLTYGGLSHFPAPTDLSFRSPVS